MATYHVENLHSKPFPFLQNPSVKGHLEKWSLLPGLHLSSWAFNEPYQPQKAKHLITALLTSASVLDQVLPKVDFADMEVEPVPCTLTSLEFFDRLMDPESGVVSHAGDNCIRGCFEEYVEGLPVNDEFRQMLLNEESKHYSLYSKSERKELLFRILLHLAVGGQWCQYEDFITPYIETATLLYKNILNVQKNAETRGVQIRSKCFLIKSGDASVQEFLYVLIDPGLREATIFSHKIV